MVSGVLPTIFNITRLAFYYKKFKNSFKKSLLLFPGMLLASSPNLVL